MVKNILGACCHQCHWSTIWAKGLPITLYVSPAYKHWTTPKLSEGTFFVSAATKAFVRWKTMPGSFQPAEREPSRPFFPKKWKISKTNISRNPRLRVSVKVGLLAPLILRIHQLLRLPLQMRYQIMYLRIYQWNCLPEVVCRSPQYFVTVPIFISIFTCTQKNILFNKW